jgi:hypothetical protein
MLLEVAGAAWNPPETKRHFTKAREHGCYDGVKITSRNDSSTSVGCYLLHEMAGVRFDDQPHFAARRELQRIAGCQGEVDFHLDPALYAGGDDHVTLFE